VTANRLAADQTGSETTRPGGGPGAHLPVAADGGASIMRLQREAGNAAVARLLDDEAGGSDEAGAADEQSAADQSPVLGVIGSGGAPLDAGVRSTMETGLGADFGDVRIHTDEPAAASAQSVQARAYTVGSDVVFDKGAYQPGSPEGMHTLAHELTHVVQQRSGPVDASPAAGGIAVSDPSDRFEQAAEASAEQFVTSGPLTESESDTEAGAPVEAGVQREVVEEEEDQAPT
jgi:hypothetical protein